MGLEDRVITISFSDPDATDSDTDPGSDSFPICKPKRFTKTFVIPKSIASQSCQNQNQIDEDEAPPVIYEDKGSDEEAEASEDAMETDEEEPGNVIDAPQFSDGSEVLEADEEEPGNVIVAPQFSDGSEVLEPDEEEPGNVIVAPQFSDGSEVMRE